MFSDAGAAVGEASPAKASYLRRFTIGQTVTIRRQHWIVRDIDEVRCKLIVQYGESNPVDVDPWNAEPVP